MNFQQWRSDALHLIGSAIGTIECLSWQVDQEMKERLNSALIRLKEGSEKLMETEIKE